MMSSDFGEISGKSALSSVIGENLRSHGDSGWLADGDALALVWLLLVTATWLLLSDSSSALSLLLVGLLWSAEQRSGYESFRLWLLFDRDWRLFDDTVSHSPSSAVGEHARTKRCLTEMSWAAVRLDSFFCWEIYSVEIYRHSQFNSLGVVATSLSSSRSFPKLNGCMSK